MSLMEIILEDPYYRDSSTPTLTYIFAGMTFRGDEAFLGVVKEFSKDIEYNADQKFDYKAIYKLILKISKWLVNKKVIIMSSWNPDNPIGYGWNCELIVDDIEKCLGIKIDSEERQIIEYHVPKDTDITLYACCYEILYCLIHSVRLNQANNFEQLIDLPTKSQPNIHYINPCECFNKKKEQFNLV